MTATREMVDADRSVCWTVIHARLGSTRRCNHVYLRIVDVHFSSTLADVRAQRQGLHAGRLWQLDPLGAGHTRFSDNVYYV